VFQFLRVNNQSKGPVETPPKTKRQSHGENVPSFDGLDLEFVREVWPGLDDSE